MSPRFVVAALAAALVALAGPSARAQQSPDTPFVIQAATGSMAEVELSRLVAQRAASEAVRRLAERIAADHAASSAQLTGLAQQKGIPLPTDLPARSRELRDRLAALAGAEVDRLYVHEMVDDHRRDIADFERQAREGRDPDVRGWAVATLPTLREHLRLAEDVRVRMAQAPVYGVPAASPVTIVTPPPAPVTIVTPPAVVPRPCGGEWAPATGTNFGTC